MVSGQELGGDSGKIDLILCDQIVIKHSREKKESEVKMRVDIIFKGAYCNDSIIRPGRFST